MSKLKVYGVTTFINGKQVRAVVATTTQSRAAKLIGTTPHQVRTYGSVSHNKEDMIVCLSNPETAYYHGINEFGANRKYKVLNNG